ncbi:NAD-dependent epimerase/dehydratase family protein [Leadbettera azotonutricia]|uniref:CDP-abequose synthase n=1 Tax=Leadbettera azotonutricia (strain ATCC BAA-888 / DSM 13862 / ZAS-9) TaxID=545695 RepID=F5YB13_LEAAZ|nr:NAD(P)-dependent oxidoreductase [Leadbettera azotonutricia]AEF83117.1 CDP-abequose synthase [Leadbettera azotonutricia ZAS-9]
MRILITGATGFVGSTLLPKLSKHNIKVAVRNVSDDIGRNIQILADDNFDRFKREIELFAPEIVVHLASSMIKNDDVYSIKNIIDSNILFTSILLESLKNTSLRYFINTGTFAEYYLNDGDLNPAYYYSASKCATRYIIKYFKNLIGFKTINIIPYTIYGGVSKTKKVIDYIIDSLDSIVPIEMTKGEQILDFIHIYDVVNFYVYCIENLNKLTDSTDYHLGTGIGTSIRELAVLIEHINGKKANILWGAKQYRDLDIMKSIAPMDSLKKLDWSPSLNLEQGLRKQFS